VWTVLSFSILPAVDALGQTLQKVIDVFENLPPEVFESQRAKILGVVSKNLKDTLKMRKRITSVKHSEAVSAKGPDAVIQRLERLLKNGMPLQLQDLPKGGNDLDLDVRIEDLSDPKRSLVIRRALAGRSYAIERDLWEQVQKRSGMMERTSLESLSDLKDNFAGTIQKYLRAHGLAEVPRLTYALRLASKHLWLEGCEDLNEDVYGLVLLCPEPIYHMELRHLPTLKERLKNHAMLQKSAETNRGWFARFVKQYEGIGWDPPLVLIVC
jgi:hypothetical protein